MSVMAVMTLTATPAAAQPEPPVGVRAAGMGGAFTAVADDPSASYWNPAGLASGTFFGLTLDGNVLDHRNSLFVGLGTPPLGLVYYTSTVGSANGRNGVTAHHAGATLVQSIGDRGLAVGSTLKLAYANGVSRFDADVGVMASGSLGQIGLTIHHVAEPEFGSPDLRMERRIRAGVSVHARQNLLIAGDMELTTVAARQGEWRDAAVGLENHLTQHAWVRTGVHWNTTGPDRAAVGSVGVSYAVYGSVLADAQYSFGSSTGDRGWGFGLRFSY